jgi:hypothetical protein
MEQYTRFFNNFLSSFQQDQYNSAYNYYIKLKAQEPYVKNQNFCLNMEQENNINSKLDIVILNLTNKIKKTVLDFSTKFTRLEIRDISEKSYVDNEELIINILKDMISKREIYAEFFSRSNSISFDQQANIREIDKLMASYKNWEESEFGKKEN